MIDGILVMLCVNDHRNGAPTGRIGHVHVDDLIQLDGPLEDDDDEIVDATEFAADPYTIAIGGRVFPHKGYSTWVGNWCWDAVRMHPVALLALLNHLKAEGWDCHEAETSLFRRWRQQGDLTMDDLARAGMTEGRIEGR